MEFRVVDHVLRAGPHRIFVEGVRPEMETGRPAVLFVGGAFDGSWICRRQLDYWASRGWPAYAVNPRGYYKSVYRPVAKLGYADYLDDVRAARDRLALDRPVYAGYSMGGLLVQKLAERDGARALVLYDSDWPRAVARLIGERPDYGRRVPPVMNFWPPRAVVDEMLGRKTAPREYHALLSLFKQSFLSGRAFRELEIERIEVDASKISCPVLLVGISARDRAQEALARYYGASRLVFEGYSHGSILISRFHEPITRRVTEWMEQGFPAGVRKVVRFPATAAERGERRRMKLHYFTGWEAPEVRVVDRRGEENAVIAMRRARRGRHHGEHIFSAAIPLRPGEGFYLACRGREDRPHGRGVYEPLGSAACLMDGVFFPDAPPPFCTPPAYFSREMYSRALKHHFSVRVMLPRDYCAYRGAPYPVLVLNDGQNQWKDHGAYGGWHTDAIAVERARRGRCRDVVLAAVVSPPRRDDAYLPPPRGNADKYVDFIADTLLPALRRELRVSRKPEETGIIGASYGANCAVYAGLRRPDVFGLVASLSYAHVPEDPVRKRMRALARLPFAMFYADCGTRWAYDQPQRDDFTGVTRELIGIAREKGMVPEKTLLGIVAEGHYHNELFWRARVGRCLEFLCPPA